MRSWSAGAYTPTGTRWTAWARSWPVQIGVAAALTTVAHVIEIGSIPVAPHAVMVAVAGWTWTFGLLGMCTRFLRRENATVRYLADSSYWVYIVHLPLLLLIEVYLAELSWPIVVKLLVTWVVALPALMLSYDLLVRRSWIGRWMNGRRLPALPLPSRDVNGDGPGREDVREPRAQHR